ncbi:MAG: peptidoglycan-associated lipoprotein Pal [Gammaproteobacteria bacterium]
MSSMVFGCSSSPKVVGEGSSGSPAAGTGADKDQRFGAETGGAFTGDPLSDPNSPLSQRVVYFEFDSSEVSAMDRDIIAAHANYLANNPNVSIILEGHADERGSREYNIALGERRARAIQQLMLLQSVGHQQMQVISFGEERPVAMGHDEEAWRLNRRVEILYSGQ